MRPWGSCGCSGPRTVVPDNMMIAFHSSSLTPAHVRASLEMFVSPCERQRGGKAGPGQTRLLQDWLGGHSAGDSARAASRPACLSTVEAPLVHPQRGAQRPWPGACSSKRTKAQLDHRSIWKPLGCLFHENPPDPGVRPRLLKNLPRAAEDRMAAARALPVADAQRVFSHFCCRVMGLVTEFARRARIPGSRLPQPVSCPPRRRSPPPPPKQLTLLSALSVFTGHTGQRMPNPGELVSCGPLRLGTFRCQIIPFATSNNP